MRGNILEFALSTLIITAITTGIAFWAATNIGNEIGEMFTQLANFVSTLPYNFR